MSEINEKVLKKVESSLNAFLNEDKQRHRLRELESFKISHNGSGFIVGLRSAINDNELASNQQILQKIEDYYFNDGQPVRLFVEGKVLMRSLIRFLIKEELPSDVENKFIKTFFTLPKLYIYAELLGYIDDHIKKDSNLHDKGKRITFQILSQIGIEKSPYGLSYCDGPAFISQINQISKFKITDKEYPQLNNFFTANKEIINVNSESVKSFVNFLKNCIPIQDWEKFNKFMNKEQTYHEDSQQMFEEINNSSHHLLINETAVLKKNPVLSLSTDYASMINVLVKHINQHADELGIKYCKCLDIKDKKTDLYFLSKDERSVESARLKNLFGCFLDGYADAMITSREISDDFIKKLFTASLLSSKLETELPTESKSPIKRNKI